jgi:hypothetical protein
MWLCYQAVCMPRWQADRDDDMMDPSKSPEGANHYVCASLETTTLHAHANYEYIIIQHDVL